MRTAATQDTLRLTSEAACAAVQRTYSSRFPPLPRSRRGVMYPVQQKPLYRVFVGTALSVRRNGGKRCENNTLLMSQFGARFPLTLLSNELYLAELQGLTLFVEAKIDPSGMVWLRQDGQLAGAKVSSTPAKP